MKDNTPVLHFSKSVDGTMFWKSSDILLLLYKSLRNGHSLEAVVNALEDIYHADSN